MNFPVKRRLRRAYRVRRLAEDLGISGRTIKRLLDDHPGLAGTLRARKCGREWRFDYPERGYEAYVSAAKGAVDCLTNGRLSRRWERNREPMQQCIREHFGS